VLLHIYDGQPHPTTGNPLYDSSAYLRLDANTVLEDRSAACIARSHPVRHAVVKQNEDATNIEHQADNAENGGHAWFSKIRVYIQAPGLP
jgi:hypothetical protein